MDDKRFEVQDLICKFDALIGRATKVWNVTHEGVRYTVKDSWVQECYVRSEIDLLQKMAAHNEIKGLVPALFLW